MKNFKRTAKKLTATVAALSLCLTGVAVNSNNAEAANKPKLNKTKATLKVGKTLKLKVKNSKVKAKKLKWKSSKPKVANVNKKGMVKALKKGKTVISVKVGSVNLKCKITVKKKGKSTATATPTVAPSTKPAVTVPATKSGTSATTAPSNATAAPGTATEEPVSNYIELSQTYPDLSGIVVRTEKEITEDGICIENGYDADGNLRSYIQYTYYGTYSFLNVYNTTKSGKTINEYYYNNNCNLGNEYVYSVDANGAKVIECYTYLDDGTKFLSYKQVETPSTLESYDYDESGNLINTTIFYYENGINVRAVETDGSTTYEYTYDEEYNEAGALTKSITYLNGEFYNSIEYVYENGKIVKCISEDTEHNITMEIYTYREDGLLETVTSYNKDGDNWVVTTKNVYDFDNKSDITYTYTNGVCTQKIASTYDIYDTELNNITEEYDEEGALISYKQESHDLIEGVDIFDVSEYAIEDGKPTYVKAKYHTEMETNQYGHAIYSLDRIEEYDADGNLTFISASKNISEYEYTDDGEIKVQSDYKYDMYDKLIEIYVCTYSDEGYLENEKLYDENEKLSEEYDYDSEGKRTKEVIYYENGNVNFEIYFINDNYKDYYSYYEESGNLEYHTSYYEGSGNMKSDTYYSDTPDKKITRFIEYYETPIGQISSETIFFENGEKSEYTEYYDNGTVKLEISYYESGKVKKEVKYAEDGTIQSEVEYDEEGNEITE